MARKWRSTFAPWRFLRSFDLSVRGIVNATCLLVSSSSAREVTNNTGSHRASVKPPGGLAIRARELATGSYDARARRGGRWVGRPKCEGPKIVLDLRQSREGWSPRRFEDILFPNANDQPVDCQG